MFWGKYTDWRKLPLSLTELSIDTTLRCGQSFRWRKKNDEWKCVLHGRVLILRQDPTHLHYRVIWPRERRTQGTPSMRGDIKAEEVDVKVEEADVKSEKVDDTEALLRHYFSLKLDLGSLYEQWSQADPNFKRRAPKFEGVRILTQDAWETLICFICSSNNNISRISQMVDKLCYHYGPMIAHASGETFHDFPPPEALTDPKVESRLRELGFGYRAKYIAQTALIIANEKPKGWLDSLANPANPNFRPAPEAASLPPMTYKEAHEQLLQLAGVGPKVADCVCLMGLGWGEAVPVDTHVWQIALRDYKFGKGKGGKTATLSKAMYDAVGDHFRGLWGEYAGWAHSVLFTADLKAFADREPGKKKVSAGKAEVDDGTVTLNITKEEEAEELIIPTGTKRKSRAKVEIKMEEVIEPSKRRRTRSQKS